jgi:hypothetical protein
MIHVTDTKTPPIKLRGISAQNKRGYK